MLIAGNGDSIFRRLCVAMGRDDLANDASLAHNDGRAKKQLWLDGEIEAWTSTRSPDEVLAAMEAAEVPASRIYTVRDIAADPQYAARAMIREITAGGGTLKVPGVVPKLSATPGDFAGGGPRLGQHTREVLRGLGYDDARIEALAGARVVQLDAADPSAWLEPGSRVTRATVSAAGERRASRARRPGASSPSQPTSIVRQAPRIAARARGDALARASATAPASAP